MQEEGERKVDTVNGDGEWRQEMQGAGSVGNSVLVGTVLIVVRSVLTAHFIFRSVLVGTAEAWPTVVIIFLSQKWVSLSSNAW